MYALSMPSHYAICILITVRLHHHVTRLKSTCHELQKKSINVFHSFIEVIVPFAASMDNASCDDEFKKKQYYDRISHSIITIVKIFNEQFMQIYTLYYENLICLFVI